jgi:hypothetical protein
MITMFERRACVLMTDLLLSNNASIPCRSGETAPHRQIEVSFWRMTPIPLPRIAVGVHISS